MLEILKNLHSRTSKLEVKNGEKNRLHHSDRRFHDWYRFVLSFPPHLVRQYIEEFDLTANDIVLDPFCGTGTTLVESKLQNIRSIGVEANPFAHFASSVKIDWDVDPESLITIAKRIRTAALENLANEKIAGDAAQENKSLAPLKQLNLENEKLLLKDSISPLPLHKVLVLQNQINLYKSSSFHKYFVIALANALVYKISNLRFGPEVGVGKIKQDAPVVDLWYREIHRIYSDLGYAAGHKFPNSEAILSDSRNVGELLNGKKVSAIITSPPYPNEKDYSRTTRLESVILDFVNSKEELRNIKKSLLRSNTRGVYKGDDDDKYIKNISAVQKVADEIERRRLELGKTSGFERMYHKVTKLYFGGIAKHLIELQPILKPGAQLAYVVGDQASYLRVMIRTGQIIGEIAESVGYKLDRIDLFRTRFSTATKDNLNEEVVVLRWPA